MGPNTRLPESPFPAQFGRIRLAQNDCPGGIQPLDNRGILIGDPIKLDQRPARGADTARRRQVLDRDRYPRERWGIAGGAGSLRHARLLERQLGGDNGERIERRVEVVDSVKDRARDLDRR